MKIKKKRRAKKRIIIALSSLFTLTLAIVLFCVISGFNIFTFIFGTKASGDVVNTETNLVTITNEAPTDGTTAADHTAIENFSYFAYILEHSNFEAETNGAANAKYNGMNVKQSVYDYRKVAGDYAITDTRSVSTFVKIYHEQFYTDSKVLYRQGDNNNYSSMSVGARSNKQEFELYGYGPDHITGYIVCPETIINTPEVTKNDDGTYTSVYELSPTVAPTYYQKKVKTNASISSYPRFSEITLTYTYTSDWKIVKASYHEIYSIYKMKSWIETTNDIEEVFTYLDDATTISQYDFYKDYFNLEVSDDDDSSSDDSKDEMAALDYLGTMASLINGNFIKANAKVSLNNTNYNLDVLVNMKNYDTQVVIGDYTFIYTDSKLYIKGNNKSYYDIKELSPILSAIGLSDITSSSSINTDDLISSIMADINNGTVEKTDNGAKVNITFNLLSYQIPTTFNFNTPDEDTVEFVNLEAAFNLYNNDIALDVSVDSVNDAAFEDVTENYTKLDFAFDGEVSTSITYKDQTYSLTGNIYLNLINQKANINLKLNAFDNTYDISLYLLDNELYLNINDILKTKITIDDIKNIINDRETNTASLDTSNINVEEIINYVKKIFISFDNGLNLSLKEELTFGDATINSINLKLSDSTYKTFDLDGKESYISFDNFKEIINNLISYDFNKFALDINLDLVYEDYTLNLTGHYYNNDKSLYLNIKYNDEIINIIYKDNVVYLSLLDNYYKLNIDEFKDLFSTNTSIDISSLLSILDDVKITYEDKLVLSIKDYKFYLNKTDKGYGINSNIEYNGLKINNLNVELYESDNTTNITYEYKEIGLYNEGSLDLSILYKEEEINLNAIYYINLKDKEISVDASVTLFDKVYNLNVVYKDNVLYLNINNIFKTKITLDEINELINKFSTDTKSIDLSNVNISEILDYLNKFSLSFSDGLNITLSDEISLGNITISNANINLKGTTYKETNVDDSDYISFNNYKDIIYDITSYVFDNVSLDIHLDLVYEDYTLNITGHYFNNDKSLYLDIKYNDEIINIIYKDKVVYLSLLDNYYKLNIDEFKDLFNTNTSIDISSLLSILDDVKVTYEDKLVLNIKDYKFYLNKTDKGYSINSNIEYKGLKINNLNVELYESDNTTSITHEYKEIGLYNEGSLDLSILYKEEEINIKAIYYINLKDKEITVDASVTLFDGSYNVNLIYKNNTIYLSFKDYNFKYTLPELSNISFDNLDIESILNKLKEIDLSSLDSLNISLKSFEFDITKVEYKEINVDESIYTNNLNDLVDEIKNIVDNENFDGVVDYIKNIIDLTSNKTLGISINNIKVSDFTLNGNINIYFVDSLEISAALTINYKDYSIDVNLILKDNFIYITFSNQTIKVGLEDISSFIDKVITKLNETFDLNINLETNINISYSDILNVIKGITLDTNKISIDLSSVLDKEYTLDINYDNLNNLIINDSNNNLFDLTFKSVDYEDLTIPTKFISEDDILDIIDYVSIIYNMIDDKDFAFNINTTLSKNGSVVATIVGDIYLQVLEDNKYNAKVNLIIEEFDSGTKTMWHQLNITLYNDMIYATYGNNESNKDKVIKAYMSYDGLLNLIESIKQFTNIKIIDDLLNSTTSLEIDLNKIINDISLLENSLVVNLEQSAIHKAMENSYLLNLVINKNESSITSIEASNIYASFTNKNTYFRLDNLEVSLLNSEVEYAAPSDTSDYIDLSNLSEVITPLYNNAMQREYEISGTVTLKALSMFSVDVPVTIKIKTDDDGIPMIHGHIDMTNIKKIYTSLASKKTIDIYYKDSYVYINRQDNDGNNYKCKIHYETFLDDITYYLLDYSMGLSSTIMDLVNNSSSTGDGFVDAADCLNSAEIGTDYFKLSLDLGEIVDNPDLGDLSLQINSSSVLVDNEYKKLFTTITNFKFDMVNVIDLTCSKLELSNIKANDNGDLVINEVDMSSALEYITDFNNNYKTDTYYKNENIVSTLTHSVIFDLGDVNNITKSYSEGDLINFPEYVNNIIEVTQDDITKYYKITGWYYDSSYLNKIDDIKSIYMKNNKVIYYAKVEDITVNLTISSDYYDDLVITTYKGADISSTIDSYFAMINNKTEMIVFSGLYSGDTLFDYKNISKSGELSLTAKFDNVNYDFVVKYGNTTNTSSIIDINSDEAFISISKYVFLLNNNVLYEYSGSVLTPKYLVDNFFSFFVRDDEKKTFTLTLYLASDSIFNDYNKITYNVNSNFNNKDYVSFYILKNQSTDIRSLLPSGTYSTYEINAWNDGSKYYSLYDLSSVSTSLTLEALITTSTADFTFEIDGEGAKITKYNGSSELVIVPRYVSIDGVYLVVNTIGGEAFMGNSSIKTVVLNDGLVTIGSNAFKNCPSLVSVYFSDSVTTIGNDAFFEATSSTYETNRDNAVKRRFYFTSNSVFTESSLKSWRVCEHTLYNMYYETSKKIVWSLGGGDFTNAYQTYSSTIIDLINSLI